MNQRYKGDPIDVEFHGHLTSQQQDAVSELLKHDNGILSATTGFGKTVTSAALIAERKVNTLIIVHRTQLMQQWIERLSTFLNIPKKSIGQIGGGKHTEQTKIQAIYNELAISDQRNFLLFNDVLQALEEGRSPLVLTERGDHVEELKKGFKGFAKNMIVLSGNMKKKEREQALQSLTEIPDDEELLVIATGKYIGEGFDYSRLDTLFLAMPISWKGILQQYVGRLHRTHHNKQEVRVYDYVDQNVAMLKKMYEKRLTGYRAMGYIIDEHSVSKAEQMKLF
ncbi:DEAD/DEAH box helicase family protein [Bacillus songklensis]|uniref:DEAD/DEAH box helicase family protein n=1 Tax=Bacillus songklensis TaxID=1069116 RepID=A0ABV8B6K6_9BACI